MTSSTVLSIHTDGAARGNPGPGAYAFVIARDGEPPIEESGCLGQTTNNLAEYTALVRALERAIAMGGQKATINSDSELLVKQMNGEYRVKNADLKVLFDQAKKLCQQLKSVTLRHVRRAENSWADRLCNEALDGNVRPATIERMEEKASSATATIATDKTFDLREQGIACLRAAAESWTRGQAINPTPEEVWDRIVHLFEQDV